MKLAWTTLRVSDLEKSLDFYSNVLGLGPAMRLGTDAHRVVMLGAPEGVKLELVWEAEPIPENNGRGVSVGLIPDDLDAIVAFLREKGYAVTGPIAPDETIRFFFVPDPDGYTVQLVEQKH